MFIMPHVWTDFLQLSSNVKNADLKDLFGSSGTITKIDIRCGFGAGAVPGSTRKHTVYATVLFASVEAATKALALNGRAVLDRKIIVRLRIMKSHRC